MKHRIIAIGPTTQNNTAVNGQSMMFQLFIDELEKRNIRNIVVDIGKSSFNPKSNRTSGAFTFTKAVNYVLILTRVFFIFLFKRNNIVYLTTAQSKVGFIRDYFIILFAKFFGNRIIGHQFGANYDRFYQSQSPFFQKKIRKTLGRVDRMIVEGDYTKALFHFLPDYQTKVYVLANGLPEKIDSSDIQAKTIEAGATIRLFYLSNLIESKGFWDVLEATRMLIKEHKVKIHAVFCGKFLNAVDDQRFTDVQEAEKAFHAYIEQHQLQSDVIYYNGLYGAQKAVAFKEAHFFLLPSYYINEGQPVSVLETLAYGCVPIVTEYRLIPMMVNRDNGFFVRPQSPEDIVQVVLKSLQDPQKYHRLSQAGINTYLEQFTADKYTDHLIELVKNQL